MSVKKTAAMAAVAISFAASSALAAEDYNGGTNPHAGANPQYTGAAARAAAAQSAAAPSANEASDANSVKELPKKGMASIAGSVADVDSPTEFTLKDADGNTIDVTSETRLSLQKGDRVRVQGLVEAEALGIGEEITGASVAKLSQ